jgi:phosphoribosylanthranilate isomerase
MSVQVKICGISTPEAMTAAVEGGAAFVGLRG